MYTENYFDVMQMRESDPFGLTAYRKVFDEGSLKFACRALIYARKFDIIHVHGHDGIIDKLRLLYPRKVILLHYHGTAIRGRWNDPDKVAVMKRIDGLVVATRDLLEGAPPYAIYVPNPIDLEVFYRKRNPVKGKALHFSYNADEEAIKIAKKLNLDLTIIDRVTNPIPHHKMPDLLSEYEYYIDIKRKTRDSPILPDRSVTALEALACGAKVLLSTGDVIKNLPDEHKPENTAKTMWAIYNELLSK